MVLTAVVLLAGGSTVVGNASTLQVDAGVVQVLHPDRESPGHGVPAAPEPEAPQP